MLADVNKFDFVLSTDRFLHLQDCDVVDSSRRNMERSSRKATRSGTLQKS